MRTRTKAGRTIGATKFKATCLKLLDEVQRTRRPITVTKRGLPVAEIVPVKSRRPSPFGCMAGTFEIVGDIHAPAFPTWQWDCARPLDPKRRRTR